MCLSMLTLGATDTHYNVTEKEKEEPWREEKKKLNQNCLAKVAWPKAININYKNLPQILWKNISNFVCGLMVAMLMYE